MIQVFCFRNAPAFWQNSTLSMARIPEPTFVLVPEGGLGNRILAMASAILMARSQGWRLSMKWVASHECRCLPGDLWTLPPISPLSSDTIWPPGSVCLPRRIEGEELDSLLRHMEHHPMVAAKALHIFGRGTSTHPAFEATISQLMRTWTLTAELSAAQMRLPEGTIGLHIRRTDHIRAIRHTPLALYLKVIRHELDLNPACHFFVCTDDSAVLAPLRRWAGKARVTTYPIPDRNRNSREGTISGFLDLMTLADCGRIYSSIYSSFSYVAAVLGQRPLHKLSTPQAPSEWTGSCTRLDEWVRWDPKVGWRARHTRHLPKCLSSALGLGLVHFFLGNLYQKSPWHRLVSKPPLPTAQYQKT